MDGLKLLNFDEIKNYEFSARIQLGKCISNILKNDCSIYIHFSGYLNKKSGSTRYPLVAIVSNNSCFSEIEIFNCAAI